MAESQKNQTEKENIVELKTNIYLLSIIGEVEGHESLGERTKACLLYTSPSPRD